MKNPISLARISLQFAGTAACVLFAAGLIFERVGENQLQEHYKMELDGKMELVRSALESIPSSTPTSMMRVRLREAIVISHPGITITVTAGDGTVLFSAGKAEVMKH